MPYAPLPLPRPQTAPFSRRFAGFSAGRLQGPMPPPLGHAPEPECVTECPKPSPLLKELPVAVTTNPYPEHGTRSTGIPHLLFCSSSTVEPVVAGLLSDVVLVLMNTGPRGVLAGALWNVVMYEDIVAAA